jgi:hypothetical protein
LAKGVGSNPSGGVIVTDRVELIRQMDMIATTIVESEDPVTWPRWMTYILEAMEDEAEVDEQKYSDFLRRLRFAITARLDRGEW